jgi:hypothetical protein
MTANHRMSSLPVTQYCGQSPVIRARYSGTAERPAVQSSYFHALCAGRSEEAARLRPQLTPEELEETESWHKPQECNVDWLERESVSFRLHYDDADKELEVAIRDDGESCEADDPRVMTVGHIDFAWLRRTPEYNVALIADIKRSAWTVATPNSLQLLTYGWAYSKRVGADGFIPGIWAATEGTWTWGDYVSMHELDNLDLWWRIQHAATNHGPASIGPHCRNCFARLHCPEWSLPNSERSANALAVMQESSLGKEPSPEAMADAVLWAQSVKDVADRVLDNAKEYARRGNKITTLDGREFKVTMRQGRETADLKALKKDLGPEAQKYLRRGEPFPYPSWSSR